MSSIETLVYRAHAQGKRKQLLDKVTEIRKSNNTMLLEEIYDEAYKQIMNK